MANDSWHTAETFKGLCTLATEALKFLALINGGGAIAVVAYGLGHVPMTALKFVMAGFLIGIVFTAIAYVLAYLTQLKLFNESSDRKSWGPQHERILGATVISGVVALCAFTYGCLKVFAVFGG